MVVDSNAGIDAPTTAPTAANSATAGLVTAGDHLYVYTFYDVATDTESLPSPASAMLTAPGGKKVTISGADALVAADADRYRLYRTLAEGTEYRFVAEVATLNAADVDNVARRGFGLYNRSRYGRPAIHL